MNENEILNEVARLEAELKFVRDELEAEVSRRHAAAERLIKLTEEFLLLRDALICMVDTFSGMGSSLPGRAFGSGAIDKARKVMSELSNYPWGKGYVPDAVRAAMLETQPNKTERAPVKRGRLK